MLSNSDNLPTFFFQLFVDFSINVSSPVWKRNAFIGFGATNSADCSIAVVDANNYEKGLQYKSASVSVSGFSESKCKTSGQGTWDKGSSTCKPLQGFDYKGGTVSATCVLGAESFIMGSTSESAGTITNAGAGSLIQISDKGTISESDTLACK